MKTRIIILLTAIIVMTGFFTACQLEEIEPEKITVTFEFADLESDQIAPVTIERGQSLGSNFPITPVRTDGNFEFLGWFNGFDEYTSGTIINADITLTAKWTEKFEYVTVSFQVAGAAAPMPVKVIKGGVMGVSLPTTLKKQGYRLDHWNLNGTRFTKDTPVDNSIILTGVWGTELNTFTVTFDSHGGTDVEEIIVYEGDCIDEWEVRFPVFPDDIEYPDDELYFLKQWKTDDTFIDGEDQDGNPEQIKINGIVYTGRTSITDNIKLNAIWGKKLARTTYELDLSTFETDNYNVMEVADGAIKYIDGELVINYTGENQAISISTLKEDEELRALLEATYEVEIAKDGVLRFLLGIANKVEIEIDGEVNYVDRKFRILIGNIHLLGREWNATKSHDNVVFTELSRELEIDDSRELDFNEEHEEYNPDPDFKRVNWVIIQARGGDHSSSDPTIVTIRSLKVTIE